MERHCPWFTSSMLVWWFKNQLLIICILLLAKQIRNLCVGNNFVGDVPLTTKILAFLTSDLSVSVVNPTDLVKVLIQAEGKLAPCVPRHDSSALNAYSTIVRQDGVRALWTGLGPNVAHNAMMNAGELESYDQVKQIMLKIPGFTNNVLTHLLSGLGVRFFVVCVGSPVDVHTRNFRKILTRYLFFFLFAIPKPYSLF
ncbi:Mitochondrial brown fat uncoupling protein [Artemisia annua]|uniref:Mitochondrial brown fat uncoupling protein n=1 Tax=Artemisia annua TaxID=35608 RepID=A0A2U1KZ60_ARTAN|nr:Mitochondrial brown fat uncoupling protein [Artemisia annua]